MSESCPYFGRPQPQDRKSYNRRPLCLACAEPLVYMESRSRHWRHASDPFLTSQEAPK